MKFVKKHTENLSFGFEGELGIEGKIERCENPKMITVERVQISIWSGGDPVLVVLDYEQYESLKKALPVFSKEFDKYVKELDS